MTEQDITPVYEPIQESRVTTNIPVTQVDEEKTIFIEDNDVAIGIHNLNTGEEYSFDQFPITIGRDAKENIVLPSKSVSRQHAIIELTSNDQLVIKDLESTNGIKVDGQKTPQLLLFSDAILQLGEYKLKIIFDGNQNYANTKQDHEQSIEDDSLVKLKKPTMLVGGLGMASLLLFAGYSLIKNRSIESRVIETNTVSVPAATEHTANSTEQQSQITTNNTQGENSTTQESIVSEPESIISSEVRQIEENTGAINSKVAISEISEEQELEKVVTQPVEQKPIRRSPAWSTNYLNQSYDYYLDGNAPEAIRRLGILSRSSRHQQRFKDLAAEKRQTLEMLQNKFGEAQYQYRNGDENVAKSLFNEFISFEAQEQFARSSSYQLTAQAAIRDLSQRTVVVVPETNWVEEEGKKMYLQGYKIERTNVEQAKVYWKKSIEILPPESEYYQKAKAKLRLYERIGAR